MTAPRSASIAWLQEPAGEDKTTLDYSEAIARWLGARRAMEALDTFEHLPGVDPASVQEVRERFAEREREAISSLAAFDGGADARTRERRRRQAEALGRVAATDELRELAATDLLPETIVQEAASTGNAELIGRLEGQGPAPH